MIAIFRQYGILLIGVSSVIWMISCRPASELPVSNESEIISERSLIITADDFGVSENINQGIRLAAELGCISAISALINFSGSIEALEDISRQNPQIGIGVHLNINTGRPVSDPQLVPTLVNSDGEFYSIEEFVLRLPKISLDEVRIEMHAQVDLLVSRGIKLDHLSSHFGVFSIYTPFFEMRNQLAEEYGVPVRSPVSAGLMIPSVYLNKTNKKMVQRLKRKLVFRSISTASKLNKEFSLEEMIRKSTELDSLDILHPDLMIDCFYGDPTPENLIRIMENLPPGTSEIIVHLGNFERQLDFPPGLDTTYLRQRECELMTITSPYVNEYLKVLKVKLVSFADLY